MNIRRMNLSLRPSVLAVQSALMALSMAGVAQAADADPAVLELTTPKSVVEVGAEAVSRESAKASEYNGVSGKGPFGVLNFDLRGGSAYDSGETTRVRLTGTNLGLGSRRLLGEYAEQGHFRINFGYEDLLRNRSDSYQTPYLGVGGNVLTLPSTWLAPLVPRVSAVAPAAGANGGTNARGLSPDVTNSSALVSGVLTAPTPAQLTQAAQIQAADLPAFQTVNLYTRRKAVSIGFTSELDRRWQLVASIRHEEKNGLKPMSTVSRYTNGDLAAVIPDLINQTTELMNLGVAYTGDRLVLNAAYDGSLFVNHVPSMSWSNWAVPTALQTMSSAPRNHLHQLSLNGSYAATSSTRITGQATYGRLRQNDAFLTDSGTPVVPVASLSGEVISKTASLKLVTRATKALTLAAGYKFDDRDNRTPVNTYAFYDAGEIAAGTSPFSAYFPGVTLGSNSSINANRPYSKRLNQLNLDADYRISRGNAIKVGGDYQKIDRECNGSWIDCVDAAKSKESTLRAEWRLTAVENIEAKVGFSTSRRKVDYNEDAFLALVPMANFSPTGAPAGATAYSTLVALGLTGYGPISGLNPLPTAGTAQAFFFANNNALSNALYGNANRISELPGMRRYNMADRGRNKVRTSINWQAVESLSLQVGLDVNDDRYKNSVYGLQNAKSWALNLDGTFTPTETLSVTLYATAEDQRSHSTGNTYTANSTATSVNGSTAISGGCFATIALRNASNKVDPCLDWGADSRDKVATLGLNISRKALLGGKLDLGGGVSYSQSRSDMDVSGGNYANNPLAVTGAAAGTIAAYYIPATALPTVKTDTAELRLNGRYSLAKDKRVGLFYTWQHMKSEDWAYDGMQYGGLSGVLPSNETAPTYNVHTVGVTYMQSF